MSIRSESSINARPRGGVVVFLDGGDDVQYTDFAPVAEANGGILNFAMWSDAHSVEAGFGGKMSWAQITDLASRGHEIACMSKTNEPMPDWTDDERIPEWDDSRTDFYSYGLPEGSITSFVYPSGSHSSATDPEGYLKYDRLFAGQLAPYTVERTLLDRSLVIGRALWAEDYGYHERAIALLRRAAAEDLIVTIAANTNGDATESPTLELFTEFCELAAELGVPMMSASEAHPAYVTVPDANFDDEFSYSWVDDLDGGATISSVDTETRPFSFLTPLGSRCLKITGGDSDSTPYRLSKHPIPVVNGETYTFSARVKQEEIESRMGVGLEYGGFIFVRQFTVYGSQIGADIVSTFVTEEEYPDWLKLEVSYTPHAVARSVKLGLAQKDLEDDTFFFHLHFDRTRFGILG